MMEMRPVEIEIYPHGVKETVEMDFDAHATRMQILASVQQLVRKCGWVKARVRVGEMWSRFVY